MYVTISVAQFFLSKERVQLGHDDDDEEREDVVSSSN